MIQAEGLTKYYGNIRAVENLSFEIHSGEILGLLGPNGAGKTTTLRLITGYMPPSAGRVTIDGYDLFTHPRQAKRRMGYLPEHPPVYPEMTVREYLSFAARLHGVPRHNVKAFREEAIQRTRLGTVQDRLIGNLSRGFQQRVGLAQVLVKKPKLLILDEPTIGLDPKQIAEMRHLIKELAGDYTVVLSSHILQEVSATCERIIIIHQGVIVAQDTHENLVRQGSEWERFRVKLAGPSLDDLKRVFGNTDSIQLNRIEKENGLSVVHLLTQPHVQFHDELFKLLRENNWVPHEIVHDRTSLEEVFLQLTEGVPS